MAMESPPVLRYLVAGQLRRDYVIPPNGAALTDVLGGSLMYAAAGVAVWESGVGLIGRVGEDYPREWLERISDFDLDLRGVRVLPEAIDHRFFMAFPDLETRQTDSPVSHFARLNLPYPKSLLGYSPATPQPDSRTQPTRLTIRANEIPDDYLDATAAHLCPLDFLSHTLLPSALRQGRITTITLDPSAGYMNPVFWNDIPVIVKGITAFLSSEEKLRGLFQGRTSDLWEMAETIAGFGCEIVVIKRQARGQFVYDHAGHNRWMIPAYPAQVVNPLGAGDAFCGGFLAGYRSSYDPLRAALHGNISASLVVEGNSPLYPLDALPGLADARLESLRSSVRTA